MNNGLPIKNNIVIPENEIIITSSRSSGPGGQNVNKSNTRITIRWNAFNTDALNEIQKERIIKKLQSKLTTDGDLIIHKSESRSQKQNKEAALKQLAKEIFNALHVEKKRIKTKIPKKIKEERLQSKAHKSKIKKMRSKKIKMD